MALSQTSLPHNRFLLVLVCGRAGVSLPLELDLSLGMRKYLILVMGDRGTLPIFRHELGRYSLPYPIVGDGRLSNSRSTHEISNSKKRKQQLQSLVGKQQLSSEMSNAIGPVEHGFCQGDRGGLSPPEGDAARESSERVVEPGSHSVRSFPKKPEVPAAVVGDGEKKGGG